MLALAQAPGRTEAADTLKETSGNATGETTASDHGGEVKQLERVEVTGSRLRRVDMEGPSPITVIHREDIEASGDATIAEYLRGTSFNTMGSARPSSGSSAQSNSTLDLRGMGSNRTLILVDGHRMASSPVLGAQSQNLNVIPMSAVERIEVLRDGASAIYGSDAIGGVVNIILRKDYEGLEVGGGLGRPTHDGGNQNDGHILGGLSSERGNITFAVDHHESGMIYNKDRGRTSVGLSDYGFPGSFFAYDPTSGQAIRPDPFPDPRCPPGLGSSSAFPDSTLSPDGTLCQYNFASVSATEASLKQDSLFLNSHFDLYNGLTGLGRFTMVRTESFGRFAAAPASGSVPVTMAADNPNNITNPALYPQYANQYPGGPYDLDFYLRNVPGGPREDRVRDELYDVLLGLQGDAQLLQGGTWQLTWQWNKYEVTDRQLGYGLFDNLIDDIANGSWNPFGSPSPEAVNDVRHDGLHTGDTEMHVLDGDVSVDVLQLPAGPLGVAMGFSYQDLEYQEFYDQQQVNGNVFGTSGGPSEGTRSNYALFTELGIPIVHGLEASAAVRYDHYNDVGGTTNPKFALSYRPIDMLLLRGTYSEGFRAPGLDELNAARTQSFEYAVDRRRCAEVGGSACEVDQYQTYFIGNKKLRPETSKSRSFGMVLSPTADFSVSVDFYHIDLKDEISQASLQYLLDQELAQGGSEQVIRNPQTGRIVEVLSPYINLGGRKTSGLDLETSYRIDAGSWGRFEPFMQGTHITSYKVEVVPGEGYEPSRPDGQYPTSGYPKTKLSSGINWSQGDFKANLTGHYTAPTSHGEIQFASWTTFDWQAGYTAPWNGEFVIGMTNMFDRPPPYNKGFGHPYYYNNFYDILGQMTYLRYTQRF
jgi:iron complex outermembrane receptor protein